jgi:glycosyltransferase involved in cell wall biosynthesis
MIPDVSVIISTYNRSAMVTEAVASVLAQRDASFELIIVDDGSTDRTAEQICRLMVKSDHPVRLVTIDNRGPAAARNAGAALAAAPLLAFLDSDDLWQPHKLKRQLALMRQNPQCAISQTDEIWLRNGRRVNPGLRHRKPRGDCFIDSLRTCLISPSAVMMRMGVFCSLGGFDEDMRAAEDYDLWLRLLMLYEIELLEEPLVIRRAGHPGQLSATVPALDRFRILALLKLLTLENLSAFRRHAVCTTLIGKCGVYGKGLARRGHAEQARTIIGFAELAVSCWRESPHSLLPEAIAWMRAHLSQRREYGASLKDEYLN